MESMSENSQSVVGEEPFEFGDGSGLQKQTKSTPNSDDKVQKGKSSSAWLHFTKPTSGTKATCNHCSKLISYKTKDGSTTSAMWNHLRRCRVLVPEVQVEEIDGKRFKQTTLHQRVSKDSDSGNSSFLTFDPEAARRALVRMLTKDELPFRFVEREGFREFMSVGQPRFSIPSRRTLTRDCMSLFMEERSKLKILFKKYKGSICLTTNTWTSTQNLNYIYLTAHFIDDDWKLNKKIINFCQIASHSGEMIGKMVEKCLLFWGIEKVFTITVDNASSNDLGIHYLKERLTSWGGSTLDGEFLHMRCGAHILSLIVKDGLREVGTSVARIRSAIRYVQSSPSRLLKFKGCLEQQKLPSNVGVPLDVETRWNSTYLMLESALRLKKGFDLLELQDGKYREELSKNANGLPKAEDWAYVNGLMPFLTTFYETTMRISGSHYVTENFYMKEIYGLAWVMIKMGMNSDESIKAMAEKMMEKFDKYWGNFDNVNMIIFVATILDPRRKMQCVSWMIGEVYEENEASILLSKIKSILNKLFKYYESLCDDKSECSSQSEETSVMELDLVANIDALMTTMFSKHKENSRLCVSKSELEKYLEDECENSNASSFDILIWWKTTGSKYNVLSKMARDVLAVPVSTIASESGFSAGGRVLDAFRSSLTPRIVEALICAQDWI